MLARWSGRLAYLLAPLWLMTALLALAVPVYTDELNGKAMHARLLVDGFQNIGMLVPMCERYLRPPPLFVVPFRLLDTLLYQDRPLLWLRLSGALIGFGWLALTTIALRRLLAPGAAWRPTLLVSVSIAGLGLLPLYLVINRPEQPLLIGATVALLAPLLAADSTARHRALLTALLVVLAAWMAASHAKAALLAPLMLLAIWLLAPSARIGFAATAIAAACMVTGALDWLARFDCPAYPALLEQERMRSIAFALKSMSLWQYLGALLDRLLNDPLDFVYVMPVLFVEGYTGEWLPRRAEMQPMDWAASIAVVTALAAGALVCLAAAVALVRRGRLPREAMLPLVGAACWLAFAATEPKHNDYESTLMVLLAILLGALALVLGRRAGAWPLPRWRWTGHAALALVVAASVVSQVAMLIRFGPDVPGWLAGGYVAGQDFSVSPYRAAEMRDAIVRSGAVCGITPERAGRRLVVDELTYSTFADTPEPYFITFMTARWGAGLTDIAAFLRSHRSAGVVAGCHRLPPELLSRARRNGAFCCLPAFD